MIIKSLEWRSLKCYFLGVKTEVFGYLKFEI
jgi:hypothetical protein